MLILSLQWALTLLRLTFAGIAIAVARRAPFAPPLHRTAWLLIGIGFLVRSGLLVIQNILGAWAYLAGPESALWSAYMQIASPFNHSRTGLEIALWCVLITLFVHGSTGKHFWRLAGGALLLGMLMGVLIGMAERGHIYEVHYPLVGLLTFLNLLLMLTLLLVVLLRGGMDWMLWMVLVLYALSQGFSTIGFIAYIGFDDPDVWTPPMWIAQTILILFAIPMVVLACVRLARARAGVEVPTLVELVSPPGRFRSPD